MIVLKDITITATSMVSQSDEQYIVISYHASRACHLFISVFRKGHVVFEKSAHCHGQRKLKDGRAFS